MWRLSILSLTVLLLVIGATAVIIAQQASPASADSGKAVQAAASQTAEEEALATQKRLVIDSIAREDMVTAEAACRALLNSPTPHALHEIVEEAKGLNKLPEVHQLYQDMIAARPDDPQVIWLKTGLAIASVHLGDDNAVDATLQNISASHGSDDRVVEALNHVAWAYRKLQRYDEALRIYQYTVDTWPQRDRAAFAQHGIVICQIGLGDLAAADQALDVLIHNFSQDADASKLLLWAGFGYDDAGEKEKAQQVYELVVQNYSDTAEAVSAQLRLALAALEAQDPNRMEQTIQSLLTKFAPTQDKGASLRELADNLFWRHLEYANKPAKQDVVALIDGYLETIANYILATWPDGDWAMLAHRDLAAVAIQQGDDPAADAIFARIMSDYAEHPKVCEVLLILGDGYYNRGAGLWAQDSKAPSADAPRLPQPPSAAVRQSHAKAIEKWSLLLERYPDVPEVSPMALYYSAICYSQMGEPAKSIECYQRLLQEWPDQEQNHHVLLRLPGLYSRLADEKMLTDGQANALTKQAYEEFLAKCPSSPAADMARQRVQYYEMLLEGQTHEE